MIVFSSEPKGGRSTSSIITGCAVAGITDEYVMMLKSAMPASKSAM